MKPILLVHGYSSEGKDTDAPTIYGSLPDDLRAEFGENAVVELNLSRWISLSEGISIDDVSLAMDRALETDYPNLLENGFHVVIHSTGALVVRNWIKNHSPKPCPIENLVHLAGAHFGSGLAHVGKGQLARWARQLIFHTGSGGQVLNELLFGSWKSLDLAQHFLNPGTQMFDDYQVREYCIIGSQIPKALRNIPIRYIKEGSSDNTVPTSAGNLNFSHVRVFPSADALSLSMTELDELAEKRKEGAVISDSSYAFDLSRISTARRATPFAIAYETAHFGEEIGIVAGTKNRRAIMPLLKLALATEHDPDAYEAVAEQFKAATKKTFARAGRLKYRLLEWNVQRQYEGHAQLVFRIRDQFGRGVEHFDITFRSKSKKGKVALESLIEDRRLNKQHPGTLTFYLRTQEFKKSSKKWKDRVADLCAVDVEISADEPRAEEIRYIPLNLRLTADQISSALKSFETTIIDIELVRLPSQKVFAISDA